MINEKKVTAIILVAGNSTRYGKNCIENMKDYKGVTVGIKPSDTVKISDENNIVVNTTKRSDTWLIQTPQCFDRATLFGMHEKYKNDEVTDDCSLLEKDNYKIKVIPGGYTNLKITTSEDMEVLKMFFDKSHNV